MPSLIPGYKSSLDWAMDPGCTTCRSQDYVLDFEGPSLRNARTGYALIFPYQEECHKRKHQAFGIDSRLPWWMAKAVSTDSACQPIRLSFDESTIIWIDACTSTSFLLKAKGAVSGSTLALFGHKDLEQLPFLKSHSLIHFFFKGSSVDNFYIMSCLEMTKHPICVSILHLRVFA